MAWTKIKVGSGHVNSHNGAGTNYPVQANNGNYYLVSCMGGASTPGSVIYFKSTDKIYWPPPVLVGNLAGESLATWYGRWSNVADDKIYIGITEAGGDDVVFNTLDTATDGLGTQTVIFAGASTAAGKASSIVRGRGTNLMSVYNIDNGVEDDTSESTDAGATWDSTTVADATEAASGDMFLLLPGWNADPEDQMLIFVDASANGLTVKRYDDSNTAAGTWTEDVTALVADGSFTDQAATTAFPHFAAAVDIANSRNVVIAWNAVDLNGADLLGWFIDDTTITAFTTPIVSNSTDDQGLCAVGLATDTGYLWFFYTGKTDGTETYPTATNIYYKISTDGGVTMSAETAMTTTAANITWLACAARFTGDPFVCWLEEGNTAEEGIFTAVNIQSCPGSLLTGGFMQ